MQKEPRNVLRAAYSAAAPLRWVRVLPAACALLAAAPAQGATLAVWTGYPELVPWYQAVGEEYAKAKGTKITVLSTTLREHEQKLTAAVPTGTGPDIFDVGQILAMLFLSQAAVRSVPLGQSDGQVALAALEPAVRATAEAAIAVTDLDEVGTATPLLDWCSLRHETQYTRLFRS